MIAGPDSASALTPVQAVWTPVPVARRGFLVALGGVALSLPAIVRAQEQESIPGATMSGDGYIAVRRPPKPDAGTILTRAERDAAERKLACPCPCTLDVFTCRTSMPCGFSPRMHSDVVALAEGGYTESEILAFFEEEYGEMIRMAPRARGFNLVGWLAPFAAVLTGATVIWWLMRGWRRNAETAAAAAGPSRHVDATADELDRLQRAVRDDNG